MLNDRQKVLRENKKVVKCTSEKQLELLVLFRQVVGKDMAQFVSPFKSQTLGKLSLPG